MAHRSVVERLKEINPNAELNQKIYNNIWNAVSERPHFFAFSAYHTLLKWVPSMYVSKNKEIRAVYSADAWADLTMVISNLTYANYELRVTTDEREQLKSQLVDFFTFTGDCEETIERYITQNNINLVDITKEADKDALLKKMFGEKSTIKRYTNAWDEFRKIINEWTAHVHDVRFTEPINFANLDCDTESNPLTGWQTNAGGMLWLMTHTLSGIFADKNCFENDCEVNDCKKDQFFKKNFYRYILNLQLLIGCSICRSHFKNKGLDEICGLLLTTRLDPCAVMICMHDKIDFSLKVSDKIFQQTKMHTKIFEEFSEHNFFRTKLSLQHIIDVYGDLFCLIRNFYVSKRRKK